MIRVVETRWLLQLPKMHGMCRINIRLPLVHSCLHTLVDEPHIQEAPLLPRSSTMRAYFEVKHRLLAGNEA
jgi:hypothetical protein